MRDAMRESVDDTVELSLASKGTDLWPAVEAAQFGRVVVHDEPDNEDQARALHEFVEAFSSVTETWEDTPIENRGAFLEILGNHVKTLQGLDWFVHWGCIERRLEAPESDGVRITLAIISVNRERFSTVSVALPEQLDVAQEGFEPDEGFG
jgi:hypothetical protein